MLLIIYLLLGFKIPEFFANIIDTLIGKIVVLLIVLYLFLYSNPILAVLALFVAFILIKQSSEVTGIDSLKKYLPTEEKKSSQFTALNQFPYTLEQEVVAKMAPILTTGNSISQPTYKPILEDTYDASTI